MQETALKTLEFDKVRERLAGFALSDAGRTLCLSIAPRTDLAWIERQQLEVEEALALVRRGSSVPIPSLEGMERVTGLAGKGYLLTTVDIAHLQQFLDSTISCFATWRPRQARRPA